MKKCLFIMALFAACAMNAQVNIKYQEERFIYEEVSSLHSIRFDTQDSTYTFLISSTHNVETKQVPIKLGRYDKAIKNLNGLIATIEKGEKVKINNYNCTISGKRTMNFVVPNTYGDYSVNKAQISKGIEAVQKIGIQ